MATISYTRLSDSTLSMYKAIVEGGGELSPRRKQRLKSHLHLLATFDGEDRSELLRQHNEYARMKKHLKVADLDNSLLPWTVLALSSRAVYPDEHYQGPDAGKVNFRPDGEN